MAQEESVSAWTVAVGVCWGVLMAGAISGACTVLAIYAMAHGLRFTLMDDVVKAELSQGEFHAPALVGASGSLKVDRVAPAVQVLPQQHRETVSGRSVDDCLAASHGVVDMAFAKCRQTHSGLRY